MDLGGLGSAYSGYQGAQTTDIDNQKNQAAATEAAYKLLGAQVLGRALTGGQTQQPQQAMAPAPGTPSVPGQQPMPRQMGGTPMPQPDPRSTAPQAGAPPMPAAMGGPPPQGMPEISLEALTQRILQTTPQVKQNPQILLAALERAAPLLDRQSKQDLVELRTQMQQQALSTRETLANQRETNLNNRAASAEDGRNARADRTADQRDKREERLAAAASVRQDQTYQRLEAQKADLARKIEAGDRNAALTQWRAIVDAQHKRAGEILGANSLNSGLEPKDKKALLDEQNKFYNDQIEQMRMIAGRTTAPSTGTAPPGAPMQPKVPDQVSAGKPIPFDIRQQYDAAVAAGKPKEALIGRLKQEGYKIDGL